MTIIIDMVVKIEEEGEKFEQKCKYKKEEGMLGKSILQMVVKILNYVAQKYMFQPIMIILKQHFFLTVNQ